MKRAAKADQTPCRPPREVFAPPFPAPRTKYTNTQEGTGCWGRWLARAPGMIGAAGREETPEGERHGAQVQSAARSLRRVERPDRDWVRETSSVTRGNRETEADS